jgi:ABC-type multidrug transport system ATPase subunit
MLNDIYSSLRVRRICTSISSQSCFQPALPEHISLSISFCDLLELLSPTLAMAQGEASVIQSVPVSSSEQNSIDKDLEKNVDQNSYFVNDTVHNLSWNNLSVTVADRKTKAKLKLLDSAFGHVEAGQVLAIMGPSGCGKTTMLNALAHRLASTKMEVDGNILVNGEPITASRLSRIARYVEQEDALIGSLTVKETVGFAAQLALPKSISKQERITRVQHALVSFGIQEQADSLIGTPLRKGISGGQKKRVCVASQLVTSPKILFLDEPTSGLDSAASREVMSYISGLAKELNLLVIISIHQPSTATFELMNHVMLLSAGKTCFFGPRQEILPYFASIGHQVPPHTNPAEFLLDLVNVDFAKDKTLAQQHLDHIHENWAQSSQSTHLRSSISGLATGSTKLGSTDASLTPNLFSLTTTLLHRSFIKSYRDIVAYQLRIAMYTALAVMMGTVWLRLPYHQTSIQTFINAIFFSGAFMSFMAVAYIPAYVEDLQMFRKERANGLYGPLPFMLSNFLIGLPYLFVITVVFSVIAYWLANYRPTAGGFFLWILYLYLDLLAAEGLVVLVTSLMPIFVVALAVTAFANGLWMCVGGFLVPPGTLNVFWKCKNCPSGSCRGE